MATLRVALLVMLVTLVGCTDEKPSASGETGGDATTSGGAPDVAGSTSSAGTPAEGGAAGAEMVAPACNELVLEAPPVGFSYDPDEAPEALGGVIADGVYFLTKQILYETASGIEIPLGRTQVEITGNVWQEVSGDPEVGSVNPDQHSTSTLTVGDISLDLERTCPSAGPADSLDFTADDEQFTMYVRDAGEIIGTVFTKQ